MSEVCVYVLMQPLVYYDSITINNTNLNYSAGGHIKILPQVSTAMMCKPEDKAVLPYIIRKCGFTYQIGQESIEVLHGFVVFMLLALLVAIPQVRSQRALHLLFPFAQTCLHTSLLLFVLLLLLPLIIRVIYVFILKSNVNETWWFSSKKPRNHGVPRLVSNPWHRTQERRLRTCAL